MAIKDQVLKNAGGLYTTSDEELSKLTQKSGRLQAPVNPMETKAIGGNADQAKMAGSPNQKLNALRTAVSQDVNLSDVQRRSVPQASAAQQGQKAAMEAKLAELEGLGDLSGRVRQIALSRFESDYAAPTALNLTEFTDTPEWKAVPQSAKDALARGAVSDIELEQIAEGLGITDVAQIGQLADAIKNQLGVEVDSQSEFLSGLAAGQIRLGELEQDDLEALGYTDKAGLAQALNVTVEELDELSLAGLEDRIDSQQAEMFDQARELRNVLSDPSSTFAAREAARVQLRQLQQAGVDDAEIQFSNLERKIKDGSTIEFDGEQIPVEQLLSNEGLELRIATALNSEEEMARLEKSELALYKFITENRAAFESLVDQVDDSTQRFVELQEENQAIAKPAEDLEPLNTDVMSAFYGDWGEIRGEAYAPNGVLELLGDTALPQSERQAIQEQLNAMSTVPQMKEDLEYLGTLSRKELRELKLDRPNMLATFVKSKMDYEALKDKPAEEVISLGLGGIDAKSLQDYLTRNEALEASGFGKINNPIISQVLDANGDGRLDTLSQIKERIIGTGKGLKETLESGAKMPSINATSMWGTKLRESYGAEQNPLFTKVEKYFQDGKITSAETADMVNALGKKDLEKLLGKNTPGMNVFQKGQIKRKLETEAWKRSDEHFNSYLKNPKYQTQLRAANINNMKDLTAQLYDMDRTVRQARKENPNARIGNRQLIETLKEIVKQTSGLPEDTQFDSRRIKKRSEEYMRILNRL